METLIPAHQDADQMIDAPAGVFYEPTVAIFAAPDAVTAEIVRGALEAEGIAAVIGEQVTDALGLAMAVGESFWGEVRVPESEAERARAIVASYDAGEGALTDDMESDSAATL